MCPRLLQHLGKDESPEEKVLCDAEALICQLYNKGTEETLINRERASAFRRAKKSLDSLPPTQDALHLHIKRAHCQSFIWKKALEPCPVLPGEYLGQVLLGMCRWLLRTPLVYSVASYRPHLRHFWANIIMISRTEFNASRLLNIKTTAGTIFQPRIFLFLNPCLPEFSYPKNPKNLRPHSSNSTKKVIPL